MNRRIKRYKIQRQDTKTRYKDKTQKQDKIQKKDTNQKLLLMEDEFISFKLWRQIKNTAIYISESGGCVTKNLRRGIRYPKCFVFNNPRGHSHYPKYHVTIKKSRKQKDYIFLPHRLVALTYLPNYDLFRNQVDHLDGNIFNNHLWNLEWVTPEENIRRATEARRKKKG